MWLFVLRSFEFGFGCSYGIGFRFGGCLFMWLCLRGLTWLGGFCEWVGGIRVLSERLFVWARCLDCFLGVVSGVISPLWVGVWLYVGVDLLGFLIALLGWFALLIWYW